MEEGVQILSLASTMEDRHGQLHVDLPSLQIYQACGQLWKSGHRSAIEKGVLFIQPGSKGLACPGEAKTQLPQHRFPGPLQSFRGQLWKTVAQLSPHGSPYSVCHCRSQLSNMVAQHPWSGTLGPILP